MPDLVGQAYYGELEEQLKANNVNVILTVHDKLIPESSGVVMGQIPAAGEHLPEADENGLVIITLIIAPIVVEVPNVLGMTYLDAQAKLYSLGLTSARFIKIVESGSGLVVDQFPAAKTHVAAGAKITLTVVQDALAPQQSDGCIMQGQECICRDTGWKRYCNYGPHRAGLYCQCD